MALLIDTSLWVDYTRLKAPRVVKEFVAPFIVDPNACITEAVIFEMMRFASPLEVSLLKRSFGLMPLLETPEGIWKMASDLGQACRRDNYVADPMDLIIATVALEHDAEVVTLDGGYLRISKVSGLRVRLLAKPK